jgi:hypothetical protein
MMGIRMTNSKDAFAIHRWFWAPGHDLSTLWVPQGLLRQLRSGAPLECMFGAFDDGPIVSAQAPRDCGAGQFTITYFDQTPVKLRFCVPAEEYETANGSVLEDQVMLVGGYAVPYGPDLQEQQPDTKSEGAMLEMTRQTGEKQPETDEENGGSFTNPIQAGEDGCSRARCALKPHHGAVEQPVE